MMVFTGKQKTPDRKQRETNTVFADALNHHVNHRPYQVVSYLSSIESKHIVTDSSSPES